MRLGRYRHYKGRYYHVLGVALDTETRAKMVLYKALYACPDLTEEFGDDPIFTRPYSLFFSTIEHEGKIVPRFEYMGAEG